VPATLPDVNAETYPFEVVQYLLDQAATFTFYATPKPRFFESASLTPDQPQDYFGINGGYGIHVCCDLHAFDSVSAVGCGGRAITAQQQAGERIGEFRCIAMFAPYADADLHWDRGLPPPAIYDRWRSQRFVLTNPEFSIDGVGTFSGFGVGRTYPVSTVNGTDLLAGAVANCDRGTGVFKGKCGSAAFCGRFTRELGYEGLITLRIPDPRGALRSDTEAPPVEASGAMARDTFIVMRGEKKDKSIRTTFGPKPAPDLDSLVTPSQMRAVRYGCEVDDETIRSSMITGPVIARMDADVHFNLAAPPGSDDRPGPFTTTEVYEFVDARDAVAGTISARVEQGISFGLQFPAAPGQPGVRFTGYGPIVGGTGPFAGAQGLLTVNSVIGIAPHTLSLTHVLQLVDAAGRFRT